MGDDYGGGPGQFELGMPMYELECMQSAGMTPLQIIMAGTKNAAQLCSREKSLGTVESGKTADILVVKGDPLQDLQALRRVGLVIKDGVIIRNNGY